MPVPSAPARSSASPSSSSPRRGRRCSRRRGGDRHPQTPLEAAAGSPSGKSSLPGRCRGGDHRPQPPLQSAEAVPLLPGRRRSARLGRRSGGDHQSPPPPPVAAAASASPPAGIAPRCSFRINLRPRVRVVPSAASSPPRRPRAPAAPHRPSMEAHVAEWAKRKAGSGASQEDCVLPFLHKGAPRKVECLICSKSILPDDRMQCSVHHCEVTLHKACSEKCDGCCPRHVCYYCKSKTSWHRVQHTMPSCTECSLKRNRMVDSVDLSRTMICWSIWPLTSEDAGPTDCIEEAFRRLPLPYTDQEFNTDPVQKEELNNGTEPPLYVYLKRNVYLVKNKCNGDVVEGGCTNCEPILTCKRRCSCRSLSISCSRACRCSDRCTNKPFRRGKRIDVVKTQHCGWGAIALETIEKDEFVIEFVGEVIDDATCEERIEDMRQRGDKNFYMCKVLKDFVIDATFKGNDCRFINHSCEPNCQLQKWQVNGKTRLGVFASETIEVGEPLTYDYRFEKHFGPAIECFCGAPNCQGNLSAIRKD